MRHAVLTCALCVAIAAGGASGATGPPSGAVTARVLVSPMTVALVVPAGPVAAGKTFKLRAAVENIGAAPLQDVFVTLVAPRALTLREAVTQRVASIAGASTRSVQWSACATSAGGYIVLAQAATGPFTVESTAQLVQITPAKKPAC